jgi:NAD dependent epimerase/dehydratase family enzyme
LGSRRVAPTRALELGHGFRYRTIDTAFDDVFDRAP